MTGSISSVLTACVLAFEAGAAQGQTPQTAPTPNAENPSVSTTVPSVIVTGAAEPKVIEKQTWSFVESFAGTTAKLSQIGRWREPICIKVVNLPPGQAAVVETRVGQIARSIGLPVMKPGCRPNIQIVLTSDPQAVADMLAKTDESALGFHYRSDLKKLKTVNHPIQAWYKTATLSGKVASDGRDFAATTDAAGNPVPNAGDLVGVSSADESVDTPDSQPHGCAGSLLTACLRSVFKNVVVVINGDAVEGKTLGTVADYAAMLALSQPKSLDGCSDLPSIVDLLAKSPCAGRDPPEELTAADRFYLRALYTSNPEASAATERGDIAGRMAEMLIKASPQAKANK